jgi:pimeloyl-ACP methyl ester carboxylesterase
MPRLKRPDGVEIHWESEGEGPLVVLAHAFFSYPEIFEALLGELAASHRVVTYHLRGAGESTRRGPYDLATDADDLAALLEEVGGPAVVVAIGDGCNRAVKAGAARPDLVSAVVTPGGNPIGRIAAEGTEGLAGSDSVIEAVIQLVETDYRAALRTILDTANPQLDEDSLRARVNLTVAHCPHESSAPRMRDWVSDASVEESRSLGDRLWILEHGRNPWFPIEAISRIRELLPDAHVEQVADGPLSSPQLTAAVVRELTSSALVKPSAGRSEALQ